MYCPKSKCRCNLPIPRCISSYAKFLRGETRVLYRLRRKPAAYLLLNLSPEHQPCLRTILGLSRPRGVESPTQGLSRPRSRREASGGAGLGRDQLATHGVENDREPRFGRPPPGVCTPGNGLRMSQGVLRGHLRRFRLLRAGRDRAVKTIREETPLFHTCLASKC